MKLLDERQYEEHAAASRKGAIEGSLFGGAVALAGSYWMQRNVAFYRTMPLSLKTLGAVICMAPCLAIQAERRGLEYDRTQWEGDGLKVMNYQDLEEAKRWDSLSTSAKLSDWSARHKYSLIMGGWVGSLGVAGAIISRNKYQTFPQKIVQARMWAQGITIGLLIVAGALSASRRSIEDKKQVDHSWQNVLEQQERDKQEEAALAAQYAASKRSPAVAA